MAEYKLLSIATRVSTPLALSGLIFCILFLVYKTILGLGIFPVLSESNGFAILKTMIDYMFYLGLLSLLLGIGAYLYVRTNHASNRRVTQQHLGTGDNVAGNKIIEK